MSQMLLDVFIDLSSDGAGSSALLPVVVTAAGVLIGALLTMLLTARTELEKHPHLLLDVADPQDGVYPDEWPAQKARFVSVSVRNQRPGGLWWWVRRDIALQCQGTILFQYTDRRIVFPRGQMDGRWAETPEPTPITGRVGEERLILFDPLRMRLSSRVDIPLGQSRTLNIAGMFDADDVAYGWNNESYFSQPRWRNPDWRLPPGEYLVRVHVICSGAETTGEFRLVNAGTRQQLRLERT